MDYEQLLEAYNTLHEGEPLDFDETATHESSLIPYWPEDGNRNSDESFGYDYLGLNTLVKNRR